MGRFAAGLETPPAPGSEFMRADCAPRASCGDGSISIADWVQTGRYAVGLDPLAAAAGPTAPGVGVGAARAAQMSSTHGAPVLRAPSKVKRAVDLGKTSIPRGGAGVVPVTLLALGDEDALGFTVTFDPNLRPELLDVETIRRICKPVLSVSQIVFPSRDEAAALTGKKDPIKAAHELQKMGPQTVVIKMGATGALAVTKKETIFEPAFQVKEVDPTGAGDVYDAAFLYGTLRKLPLEKTLEFAGAAGAIKVTRFGPMGGPSSLQEVEDFIQKTLKKPTPKEMSNL
jgi:hypothetical protein